MIAVGPGRAHRRWSRALLAIDDDESWHRNVVRRQARRRGDVRGERRAGRGLPRDRRPGPRRAAARASATATRPPSSAGCARATTGCERWETDWSSQTGACQAGLLHGDNDDMPAFRWWEKDRGKPIVTNHPRDAEELERRHSERARAAPRRRRQPREHPLRRRHALDAHDEHGAPPPPADRPRLLGLLRPAVRGGPHAGARAGRHRARAPRRRAPAARRRSAASAIATAATRWSARGGPWSSATSRSPRWWAT